ncbi:prokaryotic cytochrome b561 family protein [Neorickettsia helminthoeca str. Oregon]|uniref:Prokaryotic cytochrome b561 family protein n=1 Tax=Neorickettsia helminthoeca str. Oregon TaxID=1286528 RepID=X5H541_9RICK|nr:cytochrome b [Neorickettsia helminthoeca]AHX11808.1 prokaryotic cytochrome b561 family protein [Neorickettsia helminthoeca str. Oregon]
MSAPEKYSISMRVMHWVLGFAIIAMIVVGFLMTHYMVPPVKFAVYNQHKAIGITIGVLMIVRIFVRLFSKLPGDQFSKIESIAMQAAHVLLYVTTIGAVISGYVMSYSSGREVSWFNCFRLPALIPVDPYIAGSAHKMHQVLVYSLGCLIVLHIFAAIKHLCIDKKNIFKKMI